MTDSKKSNTAEEEIADDESAEEETEEETTDEEESSEEESEEEDESESSDTEDETDYDAEIEKEKKKGLPDPKIAEQAFKKRKEHREGDEDDSEDEDKPLTRKEYAALREQDRKDALESTAMTIARTLAGSDKEAQLIVLKWKNRTFPSDLSLAEQVQEAYVITHQKKILGERNEALRGLKGKQGVKKDGSGSHQDPKPSKAPKLPPADMRAILDSGFAWNATARQYEKKLPNGDLLIRDSKTGQTRYVRKGSK